MTTKSYNPKLIKCAILGNLISNFIVSNPCSRCGKERIVKKTWKEQVGNSVLTYTDTVCSDPECQKKVDAKLKREKAKRESLKLEAEKKDKIRKAEKAKLIP